MFRGGEGLQGNVFSGPFLINIYNFSNEITEILIFLK